MRDQPAVFLELFFTRATDANTPLVPGEVGPHALQPGHRILKLGQLNLEMGFMGAGVGREDVEDDLGTVDDFDIECALEISRLRWPEVVVEDDDVRLVSQDHLVQLLDLARPDVGGDVDLLPLLKHRADDLQASRPGQAANFVEGVIIARFVVGEDHPDKKGTFRTSQTLGAF